MLVSPAVLPVAGEASLLREAKLCLACGLALNHACTCDGGLKED
jgi:hypothetical protein